MIAGWGPSLAVFPGSSDCPPSGHLHLTSDGQIHGGEMGEQRLRRKGCVGGTPAWLQARGQLMSES